MCNKYFGVTAVLLTSLPSVLGKLLLYGKGKLRLLINKSNEDAVLEAFLLAKIGPQT